MNKENINEIQDYILRTYQGCRLRDVCLYTGNLEVPFENKQGWHLCDIAVELQFDDELFFTYCFDPEWEVFDFFDRPYTELVPDTQTRRFRQESHSLWRPFIGSILDEVQCKWNWYQDYEEKTYYIPQLIELIFTGGQSFVIAAVEVSVEGNELTIQPDSEGEIMIAFGTEIKSLLSKLNSV